MMKTNYYSDAAKASNYLFLCLFLIRIQHRFISWFPQCLDLLWTYLHTGFFIKLFIFPKYLLQPGLACCHPGCSLPQAHSCRPGSLLPCTVICGIPLAPLLSWILFLESICPPLSWLSPLTWVNIFSNFLRRGIMEIFEAFHTPLAYFNTPLIVCSGLELWEVIFP